MNTKSTLFTMTLLFLFLTSTLAAQTQSVGETLTPEMVERVVEWNIAPKALGQVDGSVHEDLTELSLAMAKMALRQTSTEELKAKSFEKIRIVYTGKGTIDPSEDLGDDTSRKMTPKKAEAPKVSTEERFHQADDSFASWDAVRLSTANEFRIEFPRPLLGRVGNSAETQGLNLGSDRGGEEMEAARIADEEWSKGWSNGTDTRILRGTYNVAQTHTAYKKLVYLSNSCSGTLVGPKHIVTAAHCIRNVKNSSWSSATAYAGRSGNSWRSSVAFSTANTWYYTPSAFRAIADGQDKMPYSATPYDIGVIVTHDHRMGDTVGWMGWVWWSSDTTFGDKVRYNRGYPICGRSNSPAACQSRGLYGDTAFCAAGDYSSPDSDGINRRFRFSCDASGGHSGSSLYHYLNGTTLVVTSVVSWEHCTTCSASDARPNTGVRITKEYSDVISSLRSTFP